jgi:hypothetical protein
VLALRPLSRTVSAIATATSTALDAAIPTISVSGAVPTARIASAVSPAAVSARRARARPAHYCAFGGPAMFLLARVIFLHRAHDPERSRGGPRGRPPGVDARVDPRQRPEHPRAGEPAAFQELLSVRGRDSPPLDGLSTTHNREVGVRIHPELSEFCSGIRLLGAARRCRAAIRRALIVTLLSQPQSGNGLHAARLIAPFEGPPPVHKRDHSRQNAE